MVNPKSLDNLIPATRRSAEQLREMGRRGGIRSGEARRARAEEAQRARENRPAPGIQYYADLLARYLAMTAEERAAYPKSYKEILLEKIEELQGE